MPFSFTCDHCGNKFSGVCRHRKYCSMACQGKAKSKIRQQICPVCNTEFINKTRRQQTYCSLKCSSVSQRTTYQRICELCSASFTVPHPSTQKKYCSVTCKGIAHRKEMIETVCEVCGKITLEHPCRASIARYCSLHCMHVGGKETTIEKAVRIALEKMKIRYESQYSISRYSIDFYIPERAVAIEADGDYWHRDRQETDAKRDKFLASKGIITIRISEREIVASKNVSKLLKDKLQGIHTLQI